MRTAAAFDAGFEAGADAPSGELLAEARPCNGVPRRTARQGGLLLWATRRWTTTCGWRWLALLYLFLVPKHPTRWLTPFSLRYLRVPLVPIYRQLRLDLLATVGRDQRS
jgi:hypothetical protein